VARPFVVISESATFVADLYDRFVKIDELAGVPARRGCRRFFGAHGVTRPTFSENRIERVLREDVLNIGDQQFLVLLFMMPAKDQKRLNVVEQLFVGI
jgi:hypothetical protein